MRFALIQEGDFLPGESAATRYHEMVKEAVFAESVGFETYCLSEQHFLNETCTVSSPESFFPYVAALTERLRFRITSAVLLTFNHPIRVAERLSTLDILSNGRAELGTARANNPYTLAGFGVDPKETRAQWNESIDIILKALTQEKFSHEGKVWTVPERYLSPKVVQTPHPPIYVSATSQESHTAAGERGIGVMTGNVVMGWEHAEKCIKAYQDGLTRAKPADGSRLNSNNSFFVGIAHCAATRTQAVSEATNVAKGFLNLVKGLYDNLSKESPDYEYLAVKDSERWANDLPFVLDSAPYFMVGDPAYIIEKIERLEAMGVNEVMLRIDGMGHEMNMQSIEAFGAEVIPHFQARQ